MSLLIDCRGAGAFEVLVDNAYAIAPQRSVAAVVPVPTLGEFALFALALAVSALAFARLSRRRA